MLQGSTENTLVPLVQPLVLRTTLLRENHCPMLQKRQAFTDQESYQESRRPGDWCATSRSSACVGIPKKLALILVKKCHSNRIGEPDIRSEGKQAKAEILYIYPLCLGFQQKVLSTFKVGLCVFSQKPPSSLFIPDAVNLDESSHPPSTVCVSRVLDTAWSLFFP